MVPVEIHRFLLGLDPPAQLRDWLYQNVELVERSLARADFLALLELDFDDPPAIVELASHLRKRVLPLLGEEERTDYLVLGDELQASGDPRGELIMLQASLLESGHQVLSEAALLEEHRSQLLGPLARFVEQGSLQVEWFLGFIVRARIEDGTSSALAQIAHALLEHPSGSRLRSLEVTARRDWGARDGFRPILASLAQASSRLTTLVLESGDESFYAGIGDLGAVFRSQPGLRAVEVNGADAALGPVPEHLMSLVVRTRAISQRAVRDLASGVAHNLERLELWLGDEVGAGDLAPLLTRERLPRLRHLSLPYAVGFDDMAEMLVDSDLLPQLVSLDLSRSSAAVPAARLLVASARSLSHLRRLDLRWNHIPPHLTRELTSVLPRVLVRDQQENYTTTVPRRLDLRGDPWW